eukprot:1024771-Karenia_brevis.AAC.1
MLLGLLVGCGCGWGWATFGPATFPPGIAFAVADTMVSWTRGGRPRHVRLTQSAAAMNENGPQCGPAAMLWH